MISMQRFALAYQRIALIIGGCILAGYLLFVLLPSYASGIYRLSDSEIWSGAQAVPVYTNSGVVGSSPLSFLPIIIVLAAWYGLPGLGVLALGSFSLDRQPGALRRFGLWLLAGILIGLFIYLTHPAADALLTYIVD